jgi:hypothetical protein
VTVRARSLAPRYVAALVGCALFAAALGVATPASGEGTELDRVVVRFTAPETGGAEKPQFVFARELAFEARLAALADPDPEGGAFSQRHVRAALDRHVAEALLAALPVTPAYKPNEVSARAKLARAGLEQRVGAVRVLEAARAEGQSDDDLTRLFERQARASLYLDRMVAPMLEPSESELRQALASNSTPFSGLPYEKAAKPLARWLLQRRVNQALEAYYQTAKSRLRLVVVK